MKKASAFLTAVIALVITTSCEKVDVEDTSGNSCSKPASATPVGLTGNWASGYSSMTQLVNAYNGQYVGNAWVSGKFFKFTNNGKGAEFYYTAQSQASQVATKATGSVSFDAGSTATEGSFTFSPCWAHYKGWGSINVDRDATQSEIESSLTLKYYYRMDGQWLRIEPKGPVHDYSSSFKQLN